MIGVETLTPALAKKLNLTFQVDGTLIISPGTSIILFFALCVINNLFMLVSLCFQGKVKKLNRVEQQGKAHGALLG